MGTGAPHTMNALRSLRSLSSSVGATRKSCIRPAASILFTRDFAAGGGAVGIPRRFYDRVTISDEAPFKVLLDGRPARTTMKKPIALDNAVLATAIAAEWDMVEGDIITKHMPLTTLSSVALDQAPNQRAFMIEATLGYLETDTACYRVEHPEDLYDKQCATLDPLLRWFGKRFGGAPPVTQGLGCVQTPELALANIKSYLEGLCDWQLGAIYLSAASTKSLIISAAIAEGQIDSVAGVAAARVEETFQTDVWGIVEGGHDWDMVSMEIVAAKTAFVFNVLSK